MSILEAVDFFVRRQPRCNSGKTVQDVYSELLEAKAKDGLSEVYLRELRIRLGKFAGAFRCPIISVTANDVSSFLRGIKGAGRTRNNFRTAIGTLFSFARACGYVPRDHIDFEDVSVAREGHSEIEVFTPAEMPLLLTAAQEANFAGSGLLSYLVLGGFAGLRTAEIQRQLWTEPQQMLEQGLGLQLRSRLHKRFGLLPDRGQ